MKRYLIVLTTVALILSLYGFAAALPDGSKGYKCSTCHPGRPDQTPPNPNPGPGPGPNPNPGPNPGPGPGDETDQVTVEVQAALDAIDCGSTPPTISVLRLTLDTSKASFTGSDGENDDDNGAGENNAALTCADLRVGQVVKVKLAADTPDPATGLLAATEIGSGDGECNHDSCGDVKMTAPIQAVDPNGTSITVLGQVVDISKAKLEGADDEDDESSNQPVDVSQLVVGQFVELTLASNQPPLSATTLEVKNFTNEVEVDVVDENGNQVDDGDAQDVQIDVQQVVTVKAPSALRGTAKAHKVVKKVLKFHTTSSGSTILKGLPTGQAKIVVTRVHSGTKSMGKSSVKVGGNTTKHVQIRLKHAR